MTAPAAIHELVEKFKEHNKEYQQRKSETELRREFLDSLFEYFKLSIVNNRS